MSKYKYDFVFSYVDQKKLINIYLNFLTYIKRRYLTCK